jgi:antagonist of KipI
MLEVLEPGVLTSIQDAGRPEWTHLGVPIGGACDPWSLAVANLLVGNDAGAAAVEMTLVGGTYAVRVAVRIGLAGADLGGIVRESGRSLAPGRTHRLEEGSTIAFPGDPDHDARSGARAYLALPGGIDVPPVLGSASTALGAGFGGIGGRRLRAGDILRAARKPDAVLDADAAWPALADDPLAAADTDQIRLVAGPAAGLGAIVAAEWAVGVASDRVGLRLDGPPLPAMASGELLSHGVVRGAIQLPPGGAPIVLLVDHQTTGGYPIAGVVITADHPRLGQLRPGESVRFAVTTIDDARAALARQREALARGAATLRAGATWDELWQSAGG